MRECDPIPERVSGEIENPNKKFFEGIGIKSKEQPTLISNLTEHWLKTLRNECEDNSQLVEHKDIDNFWQKYLDGAPKESVLYGILSLHRDTSSVSNMDNDNRIWEVIPRMPEGLQFNFKTKEIKEINSPSWKIKNVRYELDSVIYPLYDYSELSRKAKDPDYQMTPNKNIGLRKITFQLDSGEEIHWLVSINREENTRVFTWVDSVVIDWNVYPIKKDYYDWTVIHWHWGEDRLNMSPSGQTISIPFTQDNPHITTRILNALDTLWNQLS